MGNMQSIYTNSNVEFSTGYAESCSTEFLEWDSLVTIGTFSKRSHGWFYTDPPYVHAQKPWRVKAGEGDIEYSPWSRRVRTSEERLVSHRILHFAHNKTYFEFLSIDASKEGDSTCKILHDEVLLYLESPRYIAYFRYCSLITQQTKLSEAEVNEIYTCYIFSVSKYFVYCDCNR